MSETFGDLTFSTTVKIFRKLFSRKSENADSLMNKIADKNLLKYNKTAESHDKSGMCNDQKYAEYTNKIDKLKKEKKISEAIELLIEVIDVVEKEAKADSNIFPMPCYYFDLANIYHKEKRYDDELAILKRCLGTCGFSTKVTDRLKAVRKL